MELYWTDRLCRFVRKFVLKAGIFTNCGIRNDDSSGFGRKRDLQSVVFFVTIGEEFTNEVTI